MGQIAFGAVFVGGEFVGLIEDDHIPAGGSQDFHYILFADEVDGGNNPVVVLEDGRLRIECCTIGQDEGDVEFDSHFIFLPLFGEATGGYNQHSLHSLAHKEFLKKEARHNGLAGAGVVGQQEAN